jgi:integration host factor subunit alpha
LNSFDFRILMVAAGIQFRRTGSNISTGQGSEHIAGKRQGRRFGATAGQDLGIGMSEQKIERHSGRTITRADLSEAVYQRVGLSRTESSDLVQMVLDEVCDAAVRGEAVKLSSFGSFIVRAKGQRIGRNPKTGVEVPILPRRVMVFKPSNVLKARINGGSTSHKVSD